MTDNAFWERWWRLLRYQKSLWFFAIIIQIPILLSGVLAAPVLLLLPDLNAPPQVWEAWFMQHEQDLITAALTMGCGGLILTVASALLTAWGQTGIIRLVRKVWGRETEPLPWSEARRELGAPFLRLLLTYVGLVVLAVGLMFVLFVFMGLLSSQDTSAEMAFLSMIGLICLLVPMGILIMPWLMTWLVAVVIEYPEDWNTTWQQYWHTLTGHVGAFYLMALLTIAVGLGLKLLQQIFLLPTSLLLQTGLPNGRLLVMLVSLPIQFVFQTVSTAVLVAGWATLYWHYRQQAAALPAEPMPSASLSWEA